MLLVSAARGLEPPYMPELVSGIRTWRSMKWWFSNGSKMQTSKYVCENLLMLRAVARTTLGRSTEAPLTPPGELQSAL